ncbi:MAG TPA: ATP-binding cassette domain-containing protein, partial [Vicinamibacteria bacterium]|nr:ATP-binding cassette domain-containing protein [Vicinamibacteria bacterium]
MSGPAVELRNVSKRFSVDGRPILDRVSFRVEPGETLVLLGSSGAGKTTALRTINRLVEPDEGEVEVEG